MPSLLFIEYKKSKTLKIDKMIGFVIKSAARYKDLHLLSGFLIESPFFSIGLIE